MRRTRLSSSRSDRDVPNEIRLVSEHLKCFSAIFMSADAVAVRLEEGLRAYGQVERVSLTGLASSVAYLLPLKSFPTRYVVLGTEEFAFLLCDMQGSNCHVNAFAISRSTGCRALCLVLQEERREFVLYEHGEKLREVQSSLDGDRWYYREEGAPQPFENPDEYRVKRQRDRLRPAVLRQYFLKYAGFSVPDWSNVRITHSFGLQRSLHELRIPVVQFRTVMDVELS
jgi:hypothetical protein